MINLLPPDIKLDRMYGRRNRHMIGYILTLALTAILTAGIMLGSLQFVGSSEAELQNEIEQNNLEISILETKISPVESVAKRLETAEKINEQSVRFSELIPQIGAVLPDGVILNALALNGGIEDPLKLDVDLRSADLAPVLARNLIESELFEAAEISSLSPKGISEDENSAEAYTFTASVTASFTGTAEAKRKEAAKAAAAAQAAADAKAENEDQ